MTGSLASVVDSAEVVVCCGSGGVGKTTTAAVLGIHAARAGRRVVVVTIDPARRLADALGLDDGLTPEPTRVSLTLDRIGGDTVRGVSDDTVDGATADAVGAKNLDDTATGPGELWAMMLDPAHTFDGLVRSHATDPDQVDRILSNGFYRNIAGALSGTQEYMAAETLHALHHDDRFDLVIVDTPPSRNALDFLEAPGVLTRFLDHRVFKLVMLPTRGGLKVIGAATQPILKAMGRVVGSDVLSDAMAFFQAFAGMEGGFRDRAAEVTELIGSDVTRFVVVASPRTDTVVEATWFAQQLAEYGVEVGAVIVNRAHPPFADAPDDADGAGAANASIDAGLLAAAQTNLAELRAIHDAELEALGPLRAAAGSAPLAIVPLLARDVHDMGGLDELRRSLFS